MEIKTENWTDDVLVVYSENRVNNDDEPVLLAIASVEIFNSRHTNAQYTVKVFECFPEELAVIHKRCFEFVEERLRYYKRM